MPLAMAFELTETRLQEGLGVRKSGSIAAATVEQRASREMARIGLGDREYFK